MTFTITRQGNVRPIVIILVEVRDWTAMAGIDYATRKVAAVFGPGQASTTVTVRTIAGDEVKPERIFSVMLATLPPGAQSRRRTATGTILADPPKPTADPPNATPPAASGTPASPKLLPSIYSIAGATTTEGNPLIFRIERTADLSAPGAVTVVTANQTAIAGRDYRPVEVPVRFAIGQMRAIVRVPTIGREGVQGSRTMLARITRAAASGKAGTRIAIGTIVDAVLSPSAAASWSSRTSTSTGSVEPTAVPNPDSTATSEAVLTSNATFRLAMIGGIAVLVFALIAAIGAAAKFLLPWPRPLVSCAIAAAGARVTGGVALLPPDLTVSANTAIAPARAIAVPDVETVEDPTDG
ncbi:Calx-beta domain-containing protein [uncultured Sphingomonas sp.]|uniref:Calx-beta domain-containing protein n=1 Tax=uncultured Sphingomonas sp. TaxID=158754 RepID=UPI0035C9D901